MTGVLSTARQLEERIGQGVLLSTALKLVIFCVNNQPNDSHSRDTRDRMTVLPYKSV
jgi:hypothetical protein